jgi:hypothetical protein
VLALALPVFVVAGWPLLGYGACAGIWLAQRGLRVLIMRRAAAAHNPRAVVGLLGATMMARVWLVAVAILLVGVLSDDETGLSAAVLAVVLFQVYFITLIVDRSRESGRRA